MRLATRGILLAGCVLSGCASGPKGDIAYAPATFRAPDVVAPTVSDAPYRLSALDKLTVSVYRVPELSRQYTVEPTGTINFPLIGTIKVVGMTSTELADTLKQKYDVTYLKNSKISVQIDEMTQSVVTVEGSVKQPTVFNLVGQSNLLEAIARAQGLSDTANASRVVVFRTIDGRSQAAAFDLKKVREGLMANPTIYPGDVIVIDGSAVKAGYRNILQAIPLIGLFQVF